MNLSFRLESIAKLIKNGSIVADIGCDHALLSIYLVENDIASKVYAIDNKNGPLAKAKENISLHGLEDKIITILNDGLTKLLEDVNTVVMAGIGGLLAIKMLETASRLPETIIIQANNHLKELRKYLSQNNFLIENELILKDSDKYYEILKIKLGNQMLDEKDCIFGPILRKYKTPIFIEKWREQLNHYKFIVDKNDKNQDQLREVVENIRLIESELNLKDE